MYMRTLLSLIVVLFLSGCVSSGPPTILDVTNSEGTTVGHSFAIDKNMFVTADHVFQAHKPLFVHNKLINISQRNTDQDWLKFKLVKGMIKNLRVARFAKGPVEVGEVIFWFGEEGVVLSVGENVEFREKTYADLIIVSGTVEPGYSGVPVYNKKGHVLGMIIGGEKGKVYLTSMPPSIESGSN